MQKRTLGSVLVGLAAVASFVTISALPTYASEFLNGTRVCSSPKAVSVYDRATGTQEHYYGATNEKQLLLATDASYHDFQTYSSAGTTYWYATVSGTFSPVADKGATCI